MDDMGTKLAKELTLDVNMQFTHENLILIARNNGPSLFVENALWTKLAFLWTEETVQFLFKLFLDAKKQKHKYFASVSVQAL